MKLNTILESPQEKQQLNPKFSLNQKKQQYKSFEKRPGKVRFENPEEEEKEVFMPAVLNQNQTARASNAKNPLYFSNERGRAASPMMRQKRVSSLKLKRDFNESRIGLSSNEFKALYIAKCQDLQIQEFDE